MSTTATAKEAFDPKPAAVDMKFEIVVIPVSDIDRAKEFYLKLGWRLDADYETDDKDFRVIQFTPPGSGCSIIFGKRVTAAAPGHFARALSDRFGYRGRAERIAGSGHRRERCFS